MRLIKYLFYIYKTKQSRACYAPMRCEKCLEVVELPGAANDISVLQVYIMDIKQNKLSLRERWLDPYNLLIESD